MVSDNRAEEDMLIVGKTCEELSGQDVIYEWKRRRVHCIVQSIECGVCLDRLPIEPYDRVDSFVIQGGSGYKGPDHAEYQSVIQFSKISAVANCELDRW